MSGWTRAAASIFYAARELLTLGRGVPVRFGGESVRLTPRWSRAFPPGYEQDGLRCAASLLRPGDFALDIGAHVGIYSLVMAARVGASGRVMAFEPNPPAAATVRRHAFLNGWRNTIRVVPCALGETPGTATLHTQPGAPGPGSALYAQQGMSRQITVPVATLDDLLRHAQPPLLPRLIKLDVEGYERRVLAGARELLSRATELQILCEVHVDNMHHLNETPEQLYELLQSLGYGAFTLEGARVTGFAASGQYLFRRTDQGPD